MGDNTTTTEQTQQFRNTTNATTGQSGFSRVGAQFEPFITNAAQAVQDQFGRARDFVLPDIQRTTPFNQNQTDALGAIRERALGQGDVNPFTRAAFDATADAVTNNLEQRFAQLGRTGSTAETGAIARESGNLGNQIFANDFNAQRARQAQAQDQLFGLGSFQQSRDDQLRNEQFGRELFPFERDQAATQDLVSQIATLFPGFGTETGQLTDLATNAFQTGSSESTTRQNNSLFNDLLGVGLVASGFFQG